MTTLRGASASPNPRSDRSAVRGARRQPSALAFEKGRERRRPSKSALAAMVPPGTSRSMADAPRLAGQHYDYLVQALAAYRKGSRQNSIMSPGAAADGQEIRELPCTTRRSRPGHQVY